MEQRVATVGIGDPGMKMDVWLPPYPIATAGRGPGILVIQEIFGVGPYIRAVAERLAAAGYVVARPTCSGASPPDGRRATTRPA